MKNAFLFPGQGSQSVGMGKELYDSIPEAKSILDQASEILGYNLKNLMFEGSEEKLKDTQYAQPAIYTCSAMYLEKAKRDGLKYEYVAGHSLGEYSALYAAAVFSFEEGLKLVDARGRAMAGENGNGTMVAVMGMAEDELQHLLSGRSDVFMANLNTKTQIVLSGSMDGISQMENEIGNIEGVSAKRLAVSGAFHSPQMQHAAEIMEKHIRDCVFREPVARVICNVTGKIAENFDEIKENLIKQITGQVRWYDSMMTLKNEGVEMLYECGNGKILRRMAKGIFLNPKCVSV